MFSLGTLRSPTPWFPEVIRTAAGSLGGGGNGDLIFPAPGGGARPTVFGFPVPESPAADSIPVPLVGLGFTFIRIVSPSYNLQNPNKSKSNSKKEKEKQKQIFLQYLQSVINGGVDVDVRIVADLAAGDLLLVLSPDVLLVVGQSHIEIESLIPLREP